MSIISIIEKLISRSCHIFLPKTIMIFQNTYPTIFFQWKISNSYFFDSNCCRKIEFYSKEQSRTIDQNDFPWIFRIRLWLILAIFLKSQNTPLIFIFKLIFKKSNPFNSNKFLKYISSTKVSKLFFWKIVEIDFSKCYRIF